MQSEASSTGNGDFTAIEPQGYLPNDVGFTSMFPPQSSLSLNPYLDSRFVMQHQDLINRSALCLTRLREATREVESLRQENATLRSVNRELNSHLSFLIQASVQKHCLSSDYNNATTPFEILNSFSNSCNVSGGGDEMFEDKSPTSVMEVRGVDTERISLPKSISVRSNGYLKLSQAGASKTRSVARPRTTSPLTEAVITTNYYNLFIDLC